MDFKRVYISSKTYVILLIVALALLFFTASMAYKQIMRMQESAEKITHTLQIYNIIGNLSQHYTLADSEAFREELMMEEKPSNTLENYKLKGSVIIDSLDALTLDNTSHQARLKPLKSLLNKLYNQLHVIDTFHLENEQEYFEARELQKTNI